MTPAPTPAEEALVTAQTGREPRSPWRVAARCDFGYPQVIVSPSRLDDGTPFPNYAWLTCPWLVQAAGVEESSGATAEWASRAGSDSGLAARLQAADGAVRSLRAAESGGEDACEGVGMAGQRDPLGVKCLHAHIAYALVGVADPVGEWMLGKVGRTCPDERCTRLANPEDSSR